MGLLLRSWRSPWLILILRQDCDGDGPASLYQRHDTRSSAERSRHGNDHVTVTWYATSRLHATSIYVRNPRRERSKAADLVPGTQYLRKRQNGGFNVSEATVPIYQKCLRSHILGMPPVGPYARKERKERSNQDRVPVSSPLRSHQVVALITILPSFSSRKVSRRRGMDPICPRSIHDQSTPPEHPQERPSVRHQDDDSQSGVSTALEGFCKSIRRRVMAWQYESSSTSRLRWLIGLTR